MDPFKFETKSVKYEEIDCDSNVVEILPEDIMSGMSDDDEDIDDDDMVVLDDEVNGVQEEGNVKNNSMKRIKCVEIKEECQSDSDRKSDVDIEYNNLDEEDCDWKNEQFSVKNNEIIKSLLENVKYYVCSICSVEVRTLVERESHKICHNSRSVPFRTTFKCTKCTYESKGSRSFRLHYQRRHSDTDTIYDMVSCTKCPFKAESKACLKKHMGHHEVKGTFRCSYCSFSHNNRSKVTIHSKLHKDLLPDFFSCEECSYTTKVLSRLRKHRRYKHLPDEKKSWKRCDECPYKTLLGVDFRRHLLRHKLHDGYPCSKCTYCGLSAASTKRHLKLHDENEQVLDSNLKQKTPWYSCSNCSYGSMSKSHLSDHMRSHKTKDDQKFYCADCPFACGSKRNLIGHVKWHNGNGILKCSECTFTQSSQPQMTQHKSLHGIKTAQKLLQEKRRKNGERCPVCEKLFDLPCHLKSHMKRHQTLDQMEYSFICAHCPHRVKWKSQSFVNHIKCHFKTDGLKCDFCSFRHDSSKMMTVHMKLHKETNVS